MPPGVLLPPAIQQFFDNNGLPLNGGSIQWYLAGTSTPSPAYADSGLVTPLANPVPLSNPGGRAPAMWLDGALAYKEVLLDGSGSTVWTADNLTSGLQAPTVSMPTGGLIYNLNVPSGPIAAVQFTNSTDLTLTGFVGGQPGQLLILRALGTGKVLLYPNNTNSAAGDQLTNFVTGLPTTLNQGAAIYQRGSTGQGWYLISHEQNAWLPWTPALTFGGAAAGMTYTTQAGFYVLKGRTIYANFRLTLSAKGTSTGAAVISGLPAGSVSSVSGDCMFTFYGAGFSGVTNALSAYVSSSNIIPQAWTATGTVPLSDANFTNASDLIAMVQMQTS